MNSALIRGFFGAGAAVATILATACNAGGDPGSPQPPTPVPPPSTVAAKPDAGPSALDRFKAAGKAAPLTVAPTVLGTKPMAQVGEVVALMLERSGMTDLETSTAAFEPPENADLAKTAAAFAEFVRANPPTSEYVLFTHFGGSRQAGLNEVRAVVVNRKGEIVWQDRQAKGDADFDRVAPREPMQCCILVVDRLRPVLGLGNPDNDDAPPGKIAQRWQKNTGVPDKAETDAIEQRGAAFKKAAAGATLLIYPAHAGDSYSPQSATGIAAAATQKNLAKATGAEQGPKLEIAKDMNEQKVLWSMAHAFSEYVKKNPPETDYVLFADYLMNKEGVGGVHFAICNKKGELVVVDFQNNHWPDFKAIDPKTREDCDKLLVKRLQGYCK